MNSRLGQVVTIWMDDCGQVNHLGITNTAFHFSGVRNRVSVFVRRELKQSAFTCVVWQA